MGTACYDMHVGQRAAGVLIMAKLVVCTLAIRGDECLELLFCGNSAAVRPWHIRLALERALCIVVSTEHYLSTIQHLLIIFNHMLPDRHGEGSVRTFVHVVSADITYLDEMYGESGYQMLLSTFRAPGNEPSQISAYNYLAQLLRGKSFRNIMSIFMSIFRA